MTFRNQIEASTNAANTSAVWKHLKQSEREKQKSLQAQISLIFNILNVYVGVDTYEENGK